MSDDSIGGCHTVCYTTGKVNRLKVYTNRAEHNMCACPKEETRQMCEACTPHSVMLGLSGQEWCVCGIGDKITTRYGPFRC
jgi:hypothetical protein